ncbi:SPOSA6832_03394 [Sporobolomyces salmonicolor]|uniref:SPOSA6832_03394-mRNA-1:cds n=1 Tax=Sporidiobolus salmonicolor TaxID=5005 RepID=A0A0D6EP70_SPOSA|nr:SPOSA6832_03394 [Sporobolomyces salmonicolor]
MLADYFPSLRLVLKVLAATLAVSGATAGTALYLAQTRLIYPANFPQGALLLPARSPSCPHLLIRLRSHAGSRQNVPTPDQFGMPYEELTLTTPDGVRVKAFLMLHDRDGVDPSDRPTVLLLHANAGNVGHRLPLAKVYWDRMRCNVLALSYRGPDERGICLDAQSALDYILSHPKLEKTKVWLYGQSIGGAVAIYLAAKNAQRVSAAVQWLRKTQLTKRSTRQVHGLVIENTFLSLPKLIPHVLPFVAPFVPFLLHQIWPSEKYIATLPKEFPVLFLAGSRDELVEPGQMKDDTCAQPHYFAHIAAFVAQHSDLPFLSQPPPLSTPAPSQVPASPSTFPISAIPPATTTTDAAPSSPTATESSSSDTSAESFELVDASASREGLNAGSMGPKEELEEVEKELERRKEEVKGRL